GPGGVLEGRPQIVYRVRTNPLFDPYRTDPTPYSGRADCHLATTAGGNVVPDRFFADLPDTGWLYPGDVVHYYFEGTERDTIGGGQEAAILPADTTGFADFDDALNYNPSYVVNCLPTIMSLDGSQAPILFWNDNGNRGGMDEWFTTFRQLGLEPGRDYDHYYTNGPTSGVGNGLGGRATDAQLAGYSGLLYTAGNLGFSTVSNGDYGYDSGPDVQVLTTWLNSGDKHAFMTGDNLATDLDGSGPDTYAFLYDLMGLVQESSILRDLIAGQFAPRVLVTDSNPVFMSVASWVAYGGCDYFNAFDAVTTAPGAERLAVFADPLGVDGGYPYSACTMASNVGTAGTSEVISLPYDFMFVRTDPDDGGKANAQTAGRVRLLRDVLSRFFVSIPGWPSGTALPDLELAAHAYPNPFNPSTTIRYTAPRDGEMSLKVYNVRGELVRTLIDGSVEAGMDSIEWNGRDERGSRVASGVYFYEVRQGHEVQVGKMALLK
ncbi:hypothetical protein DRQ50_11665, partial [bacterium]